MTMCVVGWRRRCVLGTIATALAALLMPDNALLAQRVLPVSEQVRIDATAQNLVPIWWMWVSPRGVIVASQPQDNDFRIFAADGHPLATFGRNGSGPGEFVSVRGSRGGWWGDTLWLTEPGPERLTIVGPDFKLIRTERLPEQLLSPTGKRADNGSLGTPTIEAIGSDHGITVRHFPRPNTTMPTWLSVPEGISSIFVRATSAGWFVRQISTVPSGEGKACDHKVGTASFTVPYCPRTIAVVSADGRRTVTAIPVRADPSNGTYRLIVVDAITGDTLLAKDYVYHPVMIARRIIDSVRDANAGNTRLPPEMRDAYRSAWIPPQYPGLRAVLPGRDGTIWLQQFTAPGDPTRWRILGARGEDVGLVILPPTVRLYAAERGRVWGVDRDADGLESIVVYRIH